MTDKPLASQLGLIVKGVDGNLYKMGHRRIDDVRLPKTEPRDEKDPVLTLELRQSEVNLIKKTLGESIINHTGHKYSKDEEYASTFKAYWKKYRVRCEGLIETINFMIRQNN